MARSFRRQRIFEDDCHCGSRRCTCHEESQVVPTREERSSAHKEYQARDYADVVLCPVCGPNCDGSCQYLLDEA